MNNKKIFFLGHEILFLILCAILVLENSCGTKINRRMEETFNGEPLNSVPPVNPAPNPPADLLTWTQTYMLPKVVERSGGGKWVQVNVKENYIGRFSAHLLQAYSEAFTLGVNGNIRGSFTLQQIGTGTTFVFLYAVQGENQETSPIGGYAVREGIGKPDVGYLTSNNVPVNFSNPFPRPGSTFLTSYKSGQVLDFAWSIDQKGPLLYMNVSPGGNAPPVEIQKVSNNNGISNIPIQKIMFIITAYEFERNTTLFVDDIKMEEY
jgi:hypothetical protein